LRAIRLRASDRIERREGRAEEEMTGKGEEMGRGAGTEGQTVRDRGRWTREDGARRRVAAGEEGEGRREIRRRFGRGDSHRGD